MKCHKPNTDEEASLQVFANGHPCPEYIHPSTTTSDPNTIECFIPVSDGEKITIKGEFKGTALHGCIDLLVDGSYLADKRIENKEVKFNNRKIDFQKAFDIPVDDGKPDLPYAKKEIVEGFLQVSHLESQRELEELPEGSGHPEFGVGALAVIISINQDSANTYQLNPTYPDMTCGSWRDRGDYEGSTGIVVPTHELLLIQFGKEVHYNMQSKHRRHFIQLRSGSKPWAKFVFYYRSHAAITAAGCIARPDESQALEPANLPDDTEDTVDYDEINTSPSAMQTKPKLGGYFLFGDRPAPPPSGRVAISEESTHEPGPTATHSKSPFLVDDDAEVGDIDTYIKQRGAAYKRHLASLGTSHEEASSKKPRMSDKKAALLAEIEELDRNNKAAAKAYSANLELRVTEQRKLEALEADEINELEKKKAALSADFFRIETKNAALEEEIKKIRDKQKGPKH